MISLIVPMYNREDYIRSCVNSVCAQSEQDYELLLIDDGSTDRTVEICRALAQSDSRIRLLTTQHAGVCAARNTGLAESRGEFVFFLDSDDVIHPMLLQTLREAMEHTGAAIGATSVFTMSKQQWERFSLPPAGSLGQTSYRSHEETLQAVFEGKSPLSMIGGVMMRRSLIGSTRFCKDLHIGEDFYFIYENLIKGADSVFLAQKWYFSVMHGGNLSLDYSYQGFYSRFLRRELVWKSEESLGRFDYAATQKKEAFDVYHTMLLHGQMPRKEFGKMCRVMKDYRKIIRPSLKPRAKFFYDLYVYLPFTARLLSKLKR